MTAAKIFIPICVGLFGVIAITGMVKGRKTEGTNSSRVQEIRLGNEACEAAELPPTAALSLNQQPPVSTVETVEENRPLPVASRMAEFFNVDGPRLPVVETITYSRKVPWLEGQSAWVVDYASHYNTSRHMIARSLNGCRNYEDQRVANGNQFNVFKENYPVSFHLIVDQARCQMWVYYLDEITHERVLVATYPVGLGRLDVSKTSGSLTPLGSYRLGENIAVYRQGSMGSHGQERKEMIRIFGTRWIPFEEGLENCTASARGLGLHGCPWKESETGELIEDISGLGQFSSDGCIRLKTEDMEELFAVIITKPATIQIVRDFWEATLPGEEEPSYAGT